MATSENHDRYEVETEVNDTNPLGPLSGVWGGKMEATTYKVTDTQTGKTYESTNYDSDQACKDTWRQVDGDR